MRVRTSDSLSAGASLNDPIVSTCGVGCVVPKPRKSEGSVKHICKNDTTSTIALLGPNMTAHMYDGVWLGSGLDFARRETCECHEATMMLMVKSLMCTNATYRNVYLCRPKMGYIYARTVFKGTWKGNLYYYEIEYPLFLCTRLMTS